MNIGQVRYVVQDGTYPLLEIDIEGETAVIGSDQKDVLLDMGYLFLMCLEDDPRFRFVVDIPGEGGRKGQVLTGFTNDPRILEIYRQFGQAVRDGSFKEGPVDTP